MSTGPAHKSPDSPIGFFHIDIAEVQTAKGRLYLFVAIDRTSNFAFVEIHSKAKIASLINRPATELGFGYGRPMVV